jgi:hypothetical protein
MLKFSIKLTNLEINTGQFTDDLAKFLEIQSRKAAREWLRAVLLKVPVFTGEARGSLKPLGQFLKVAVPIKPVAIRKGHSPETGAAQSSFSFSKISPYYIEFIFNEAVVHYLINEFYDVNPPINLTHLPRPWFSFNDGKIAYQKYLKEAIKTRFPRIQSYYLRGIVQSNGKQISISKTPNKSAKDFLDG